MAYNNEWVASYTGHVLLGGFDITLPVKRKPKPDDFPDQVDYVDYQASMSLRKIKNTPIRHAMLTGIYNT